MAKLKTLPNQAITLAATPERLSVNDLVKPAFVITALPGNTGNVFIGEFGVAANGTGTVVEPGKSYGINPGGIWGKEEKINLKNIGAAVAVDGEGVSVSFLEQ